MEINIAVIPGDGIGPEITEATEQVLKRVCEIYGHVLNITHVKACSSSIEETGEPLPKESLKKCLQADAVLLGNTVYSIQRIRFTSFWKNIKMSL